MLGGHASVNCLPESQFISEYALLEKPVPELVDLVLRHDRFRLWGILLTTEQVDRLRVATDFSAMITLLADFYAKYHGRGPRATWLEHAPSSVSAFLRLAGIYPQARFIHVIRDGRAVAASWLRQDWGPRHVLTVADVWGMRLAQGLAAEAAMPERVLRLHYEDVVRAPEDSMRRVTNFLELDFDAAMLDARGFILPGHSKSTHGLLTNDSQKGISCARLESWRGELSARQIELFEQRSGDLLPLLGYSLTQRGATAPTRLETVALLLGELWGRLVNLRRRKRRHRI